MEDSSNQIQEVEEGDQSRGELRESLIQPQLPSDHDKESISEEVIEQVIEGDPEVEEVSDHASDPVAP